jgi:hypothetical protein
MEIYIVNTEQLFLLCALHGNVKARNLEEYSWTWRHYQQVQKQLIDAYPFEDKEKLEKRFENEARQNIPALESKEREFILFETDFGFDLSDAEEDLAWYHPPIHGLIDISKWVYKGNFMLSKPLSKKEKFFLENYFFKSN